MPKMKRPLLERLMARVRVEPDGCWAWTGAVSGNGYGHMFANMRRAVRLTWAQRMQMWLDAR